MRTRTHNLLVCFVVFVCVGCATSGRIDSTAAVKSPDDAYFVLHTSPGSYSPDGRTNETFVGISEVDVKDGKASFGIAVAHGGILFLNFTENGYIVGKARHGGDTLGVFQLAPSGRYSPCGYTSTIVFEAPAGKVVYITDIEMSPDWSTTVYGSAAKLNVSVRSEIEAARTFLKGHYPLLADKLEMGKYKLMECDHVPY